jgi:hypothetical protein
VSWFKLTDDERREWRQNPITQEYIAELRAQAAADRDDVVTAVIAGDETAISNARRMAGRVDGFEAAIRILETDQ